MKRRPAFVSMFWAVLVCGTAAAQPLPPAPPPPAPKPVPTLEPLRNLPAGAPRSQGPLSLLVLVENSTDPSDAGVRRIVFREEATSRDYFTRYDGGSMTATLRVRCAAGEFQLESLRLYSRNNLSGDLLANLDRRSEWRTAASDPVVRRAMDLACGRAPAPAPARTVAAAPVLRGAVGAPPKGPTAWAGAAQVGATGDEAGGRDELARLRRAEPALMRGLSVSVAPATVEGRTVYRLLVTGFADRSSGGRFCAALARKGRACFLRDAAP